MSIYLYKNNRQTGPFEENNILEWLKNGQLAAEDFACRYGANEWKPLKILFPQINQVPMQSFPLANVQNVNQPVVNWAKQNLQKNVGVQLRYQSTAGKIFVGLLCALLAVVFFAIFAGIIGNAISEAANNGWSDQMTRRFSCIGVLLVIFAAVLSATVFSLRSLRGKFVKTFNAEVVETRGGQKYEWKNLCFLNYKQVHVARRNAVQSAMFAGVRRVTVELIFESGKAIVPPLIVNQAEILGLLETMPVQRRDNGLIRQN